MAKNSFSGAALIGMSDGWIIPFVFAAALTGAGLSTTSICLTGLIITIVAAIAMGLGSYFSAREQPEDPDDEKMWRLYQHIGLSKETQQIIRKEMAADAEKWQQKMVEEYELADVRETVAGTGWQIALSYLLAGLLSLLPFFFLPVAKEALVWSGAITFLGLLFLSIMRSRLLSLPLAGSLIRYFSLAGFSALLAFYIGSQLG